MIKIFKQNRWLIAALLSAVLFLFPAMTMAGPGEDEPLPTSTPGDDLTLDPVDDEDEDKEKDEDN